MTRSAVFNDRDMTPAKAQYIGGEHAHADERPSYRGPEAFAFNRKLYQAWLTGYSAVAVKRWPNECVKVAY